jgi:cobalt transporter subunit CbtA
MLSRILIVAVIAGALSGVAITALQMVWSVPLIIAAEAYESGPEPVSGHVHAEGAAHDHDAHHHGDADVWAPEDGIERTLWTAITNILLGVGGGLIIAAFMAFRKNPVTLQTGVVFGLAAFASVSLAPALGLPPELPGMAAAALEARQTWWLSTAIATAVSIAAVFYAPRNWMKFAAVALLVLPHLIGAPQPASHQTAVPDALIQEFIVASLVTAAVFWTGLGSLVGVLGRKFDLTASRPVVPA